MTNPPPRAQRPAAPRPPPRSAAPATEIDSAALLKGQRQVAIRHGGDLYWLRATRQGKLLLTK